MSHAAHTFNYLRNQRIRTSTPTERISLRSNYFNDARSGRFLFL